jgi:hypothetical protein
VDEIDERVKDNVYAYQNERKMPRGSVERGSYESKVASSTLVWSNTLVLIGELNHAIVGSHLQSVEQSLHATIFFLFCPRFLVRVCSIPRAANLFSFARFWSGDFPTAH